MSNHRNRGVTMVELLTVIAVVAILVALAVPSYRDYFEKARLRGAADELATLLAEARQDAVKQNKQVSVRLMGIGPVWCAGATRAPDPAAPGDPIPNVVACDCAGAPATCNIRAIASTTFRGVRRPVGTASQEFVFDPKLGTLRDPESDAGMTGFLSASGRFALRVDVNPIGHTRVCRFGGGIIVGYPDC